MKRREEEQKKVKKEEDPKGLLQDGLLIPSSVDPSNYHVELNNKVIMIKRPNVDNIQSGIVLKSAVKDGESITTDPKNMTKRSKATVGTTSTFNENLGN